MRKNLTISFLRGSQRIIFRCLLGLLFVFSSQSLLGQSYNPNHPYKVCHDNGDGTYTSLSWPNLNGGKQAEYDEHIAHGDSVGECEITDSTPPVLTSSVESSINDGSTSLGSVSANETIDTWSVGGDDASKISIAGGTLTLNTAANYQTQSSYSFTVTAADASGNTTTTSAFTQLKDKLT